MDNSIWVFLGSLCNALVLFYLMRKTRKNAESIQELGKAGFKIMELIEKIIDKK